MYYTVNHLTRYRYSAPVYESVMQIYMQPRTENFQHCFSFETNTTPKSRVLPYRDGQGNVLHSFNIPGNHTTMSINAHSVVEVLPAPPIPEALAPEAWDELDQLVTHADYFDALAETPLTEPTDLLQDLAKEIGARRRDDPLTVLRQISTSMYERMEYNPYSTKVDSPIDVALENRAGVCQDFSHIMLALLRELRVPCRYVSGYLAHQDGKDRSAADATHAWVDAYLPGIGWVGFDPTNNVIAGDHHIRVAIGRDYTDVPPTRGVFKGEAKSELSVAVQVMPMSDPAAIQDVIALQSNSHWQSGPANESTESDDQSSQQAQQQQ